MKSDSGKKLRRHGHDLNKPKPAAGYTRENYKADAKMLLTDGLECSDLDKIADAGLIQPEQCNTYYEKKI